MTNDRISRRKLLGATAAAGSLGLGSGASVRALLGEETYFADNTATGGTLDLLLTAAADVDPETWAPAVTELGSDAAVTMTETCGTAGLAFTVCGNPGSITLSTAVDVDEVTGDTLAHEPFVTLFTGDCTDGRVLAAGRLSTVRADLADGIPLPAESRHLGTVEAADIADGAEVAFDHDGETVVVGVDTVERGGEVVGVDLSTDGAGLSQVTVKGGGHPFPDPCETPPWATSPWLCSRGGPSGRDTSNGDGRSGDRGNGSRKADGPARPGTGGRPGPSSSRIGVKPYFFDCATTATDLRTRDDGATGVSHLELFVCEQRCFDCATQAPFPVFVAWADAIDERQLDLELSARQCRHAPGGEDR